MKGEKRTRRSPAKWLADDLKKVNKPTTVFRTLKARPGILAKGLIHGLVVAAGIALALVAFGNLSSLSSYAYLAALAGALEVSRLIYAFGPDEAREAEWEARLEAARSQARSNLASFYANLESDASNSGNRSRPE